MNTAATTVAAPTQPHLPRSTPQEQGVDPQAILDFVRATDEQVTHTHSFMLLRHGKVVAEAWWEPYTAQEPHMLFSLTKSFASSAIGMAVAEGKLSLDDQVIGFFPEGTPANPDEHLRAMRIRHLLMMSSGHSKDPTGFLRQAKDGNWPRAFLQNGPDLAPGSRFVYNSGASYMLGAILHRVTGQTLKEYLTPRLFRPLGIAEPEWETCPQGLSIGGWGLSLKTEDIAKFGQMLLNQGKWNGQQILTADWIREASKVQIMQPPGAGVDWVQGYGFQFWRCRHNLYRGDGAFGQYCIVMPEQDAVLAITSGSNNMGLQMDLAWQHLLPALNSTKPLAASSTAQSQLQQKLASLQLPTVKGEASNPIQAQIAGREYLFTENPIGLQSLRVSVNGQTATVEIKQKDKLSKHVAGYGQWQTHAAADGPAAASYAWSDDAFVTTIWFTRTTFAATLTCTFKGDEVSVEWKQNVSFGETRWGPLIGRAAELR